MKSDLADEPVFGDLRSAVAAAAVEPWRADVVVWYIHALGTRPQHIDYARQALRGVDVGSAADLGEMVEWVASAGPGEGSLEREFRCSLAWALSQSARRSPNNNWFGHVWCDHFITDHWGRGTLDRHEERYLGEYLCVSPPDWPDEDWAKPTDQWLRVGQYIQASGPEVSK